MATDIAGVVYPLHVGKGIEGEVFDREEPVQVVYAEDKPKRRQRRRFGRQVGR